MRGEREKGKEREEERERERETTVACETPWEEGLRAGWTERGCGDDTS